MDWKYIVGTSKNKQTPPFLDKKKELTSVTLIEVPKFKTKFNKSSVLKAKNRPDKNTFLFCSKTVRTDANLEQKLRINNF